MTVRTKKTILYIIFIILDFLGFVSLYFFVMTHAALFMLISIDLHSVLLRLVYKYGGRFTYFFRAIEALFITFFSIYGWWFSYEFIIKLVYPGGM